VPDRDYMYRGTRTLSPFTLVVKWLLIGNAVAFLVQAFVGEPLVRAFGLMPENVAGLEIWRLLTYLFLHGDVLHLFFNLLILYFFGIHIEARMGARRFLVFYLTAGAFAGLVFCAARWLRHSPGDAIGASGAIMAVMVVFALWWPFRQIWIFGLFPVPAWALVGFLVLLDLAGTMRNGGGTAFEAHLGGAVYGYLFLRFAPALERWARSLRSTAQRREDSALDRDQKHLDRILEKVHEQGLQSLTWRERRFLRRYSRKHGPR